MKRVIIIHCWEGYPKYCWYPYVKKELEEKHLSKVEEAIKSAQERLEQVKTSRGLQIKRIEEEIEELEFLKAKIEKP